MVSRHSYALVAAGSVGRTLIGRLPARSRQIGPVAAVSFRVASRIANSLRAGHAARDVTDIAGAPVVLFHAPPDQMRSLLDMCLDSPIDWRGKTIVFCDCEPPRGIAFQFHRAGAATAIARMFGVPGFAAIQGCAPAMACARRIVRDAGLKPLEIRHDQVQLFSAAITLGTAAVTPLIDRIVHLFRSAGLRDADSIRLAESLVHQTARGYAHSGRQSWTWHIGAPCGEALLSQMDALEAPLRPLFGHLLLLGFETFDKHAAVASSIRGACDIACKPE